jgi:hypothetical protein
VSGSAALLAVLREKNPGLPIDAADAPAFAEYGRVLVCPDTAALVDRMKREAPIGDGVSYLRSVTSLEDAPCPDGAVGGAPRPGPAPEPTWRQYLERTVFGGLPVQVGWCVGRNSRLNALEYHKSSEVLVAGSDLLLLLGRVGDIQEHRRYDPALIRAFLIREGQAVETWAATLHFAPVMASEAGFRAAIALPEGTNAPLPAVDPGAEGESGLLWAVNKWLIACPGSGPAGKGARAGIERNREVAI